MDEQVDRRGLVGAVAPDAEVRELALAKGRIQAVLAELGATVADTKAHSKLLFRSLGDYALEKLGMKGSSFSHLISAGRRLRELPEISKALHAGELNWSQVIEICRVATPETESAYLSLAKGRTVRWLRRAIPQLQMSAGEAAMSAGGATNVSSGENSLTPAPSRGRGERENGNPEGEGTVDLTVDPSPDGTVPRPEPWGRMRLKAPLRMILKWEVFQDFCRKIEGRPVSQAECLFMLAGEASTLGLPDQVTQEARFRTPEVIPSSSGNEAPEVAGLREAESVAQLWPQLSWDAADGRWSELYDPSFYLDQLDREDPLALDRRFVAARVLLQQLDHHLGRCLRAILETRLSQRLGFSNFETYVQERLGISKSRAFALIKTDRQLELHPIVLHAYRQGVLSGTQACALSGIAGDRTAEAWIQFARTHPVAHLLRAVRYCQVASFSHPELTHDCFGYPPSREVELNLQMSALAKPEEEGTELPSCVPAEELTETLTLSGQLWVIELLREVILRVISQALRRMRPWEALEYLIDDFVNTHGTLEHKEPAVLVRDDYRCQVPCCTRSVVEIHHIRLRSAGGSNEHSNLTAICPFHHAHGIHSGRLKLSGTAPLNLNWAFRLKPGAKAFECYKHQQRISPRLRPWKPAPHILRRSSWHQKPYAQRRERLRSRRSGQAAQGQPGDCPCHPDHALSR